MTKTSRRKYAHDVNPQINPNLKKRIGWSNIANAVGKTEKYATSTYSKKGTTTKDKKTGKKTTTYSYNYPWKVTAHDFQFEIPSCAYISKIKVGVRMKTDKKGTGSTYPSVGFYIADKKGLYDTVETKKFETGWHNGVYWAYSKKKLSTTFATAIYEMSGDDFRKGGYTISDLNKSYCGVDLNFSDENESQTVLLKWVWMEVEYEIPSFSISENWNTTSTSRRNISSGFEHSVTFDVSQVSNANGGTRTLKLDAPWGVEITGVSPSSGSYDYNNNTWSINCKGKKSHSLDVNFRDYTVNDQQISLVSTENESVCFPKISKSFYFKTTRGVTDGYNVMHIDYASENPPHQNHKCCFNITSVNQSDDEYLWVDIRNSQDMDLYCIALDGAFCHRSVEILETNLDSFDRNDDGFVKEGNVYEQTWFIPKNTNISVKLKVPDDEQFNLGMTLCIRPHTQGSNTLTASARDSGKSYPYPYDVLSPYSYHIGGTTNDKEEEPYEKHYLFDVDEISFVNHRIASELDTGAFILPCKVKDGDATMIQGRANIHMYKWEQIDYIGCVPVEHHHFDPKSTYKDTLLDNHYKNKRYMGKQLASDEDITLNIRLHPKQVTTIQGLIDMDKPIPVNANHKCFEGDALNHRGWCEIYSIKAEETNPHWYKCDIDVKYLTHNLNTRFLISKGSRTFPTYGIPQLLAEVNQSGDALALNQTEDLFIVDTDGTYAYYDDESDYEPLLNDDETEVIWYGENSQTQATIDDVTYTGDVNVDDLEHNILYHLDSLNIAYQEPLVLNEPIMVWEDYSIQDNLKNSFTLDEGQHINIKSKDHLSSITQVSLDWLSSKLDENKENAISRIIRLVDDDGNSVFEYEYCDIEFETVQIDENQITNEYITSLSCRVIGRKRVLGDFIEVINQTMDLKVNVEDGAEDEDSDATVDHYGSTVHFQLNNNRLVVIDEGYSGKEITSEAIELEGNKYKYEVEFRNNNTDGEDADIVTYLDIVMQDNILDSKYSSLYDSLYVSPFPVKGKQIAFTRNAEEGTIYYLKDDAEEFSYLIEPYYQYFNGVDLRASSDGTDYISIFNLNYGYKTVYLENGLVSLGINRLNGQMYLRKWDNVSKEYVTLFNLHLNKFDDVNINSISDDRIELQASDTTIIMYRGHPYVILRHQGESLGLDTKFHQVWGQSVDGYSSEYPVMFDLMNTDNMLPVCVTSKLDDDCVVVSEEETNLPSFDIEVVVDNEVDENTDTVLNCTGVPEGGEVFYLIDGDEIGSSISPNGLTHKFEEDGAYKIVAVYCGDDTHSFSVSEPKTIQVKPVEDGGSPSPTPSPTPTPTGSLTLEMSYPKTMTYRDGQKVVFTLKRGGVPLQGEDLEVVDFNYINTQTTNAKGQVTITNKRATNHPKTYKIGARYYEGGKLLKKVFNDITVKKGTAKFELNHLARETGNYFSVKLKGTNGYNIPNVNVKINDAKKKTNDNGNAFLKIKKTGKYNYVCTFNGNKDYKKATFKKRETIKS